MYKPLCGVKVKFVAIISTFVFSSPFSWCWPPRLLGRKSSILTHRSLYKLSELVRSKEYMQNGHLLAHEIRLDAFLSAFYVLVLQTWTHRQRCTDLLLETDFLLTLKQRCVKHIPCQCIATNTHELDLVEMHHVLRFPIV